MKILDEGVNAGVLIPKIEIIIGNVNVEEVVMFIVIPELLHKSELGREQLTPDNMNSLGKVISI
jgi:hypothetical protein